MKKVNLSKTAADKSAKNQVSESSENKGATRKVFALRDDDEVKEVESKEIVVKETSKNPLKDKAIPETFSEDQVAAAQKRFDEAKKSFEIAKAELKKVSGKAPKAAKKSTEPKGPGVIETIQKCLSEAGKKGISKAEILDKLVALFPDREKVSMEKTINVQLPGRLAKEKGLKIKKLENGAFVLEA
jgi:hypothetical protein